MYSDDGVTKASDYYEISDETYISSNFLLGSRQNTDTFAVFSYPNGYDDYRGYLCYDVVQASPGMIVDGWINYTHQQSFLRYPAITSRQHRMSGVWDNFVYDTIQDAIQFYPSEQGVEWL